MAILKMALLLNSEFVAPAEEVIASRIAAHMA